MCNEQKVIVFIEAQFFFNSIEPVQTTCASLERYWIVNKKNQLEVGSFRILVFILRLGPKKGVKTGFGINLLTFLLWFSDPSKSINTLKRHFWINVWKNRGPNSNWLANRLFSFYLNLMQKLNAKLNLLLLNWNYFAEKENRWKEKQTIVNESIQHTNRTQS